MSLNLVVLLYLVASLLEPGAGRVERPEKIGLVFQDDRLLPWRRRGPLRGPACVA